MSSLVELRREGDVFILSMNHGDNRISKRVADELNAHLDTVERFSWSFVTWFLSILCRAEGAVALVTTGNGKYFSNGLDVQVRDKLLINFTDNARRRQRSRALKNKRQIQKRSSKLWHGY